MVSALGANAFPDAILKKLTIEIAGINTDTLSGGARLAFSVHHIDAAGDDDRRADERE